MDKEVNKLSRGLTGDRVGGDKITVGDIDGSYNAIGAGASVIVNQIQQALSAVNELEKSIQVAERQLAVAIQTKLDNIAKVAADVDNGRSNPYKALLDYDLKDAPFFYGRAEAITTMQEKMGQNKLTILHSESGSGKTSLMQAGLASRLLAQGHFPLYLRPYRQPPGQSIKRAFLADYATQPELQRFSDGQMSLKGFLERVTHYLGDRRLYIFLDQFEEFFTELAPEEQQSFAAELQACINSDLPVWWILGLRKEYFSDLRLFRTLNPFDNDYFLPTFKLEEAQEVIIEPAARKKVVYEEGLIDEILQDLNQDEEGISPVQMQLVCYTLFAERLETNSPEQITWTLYQKPRGRGATGVEGILTSHLTRVLNRELSGQERQTASRILEALTTSQKIRTKKSRQELLSELGLTENTAELDEILGILYANRLIRQEKDENDDQIYELTHDYLLKEIELDPETQGRKLAQEIINQELLIWQENGRSRIAADKLAMIEPFQTDLTLSAAAQNLITLSQDEILQAEQAEEKMRKRQLYLAWSTTAVFAIIASILLYPYIRNWYYQSKAKSETWLVTLSDNGRQFKYEGHEVSNLQYTFCEKAQVCSSPKNPTYGYLNPQKEDLPIVGITAHQAQTYCSWLNRHLPTFQEWQIAYSYENPTIESANLARDADASPALMSVTESAENNPVNKQLIHIIGNATEWSRSFDSDEENTVDLWNGKVDALCAGGNQGICEIKLLLAIGGSIFTNSQYFKASIPISPFETDEDVGFRCITK